MLSELRDNLLGVVIASLPGFIFAFFGIHEIMTSYRKRKQETARAIGKVLSFVTRESRTGRYRNVIRVHDSPVVEFNANGTTVQHKSDIEYKENTFKIGEVVDLFYDPNDPAHFHLEREFDHLPHLGVIFIATGIGWVVFVCTSVVLFPM